MSEFIGYIEAETPKAFLFWDHFWHKPEWIPKSQTTMYHDHESFETRVKLTAWICKQNEFEEFTERLNDDQRS